MRPVSQKVKKQILADTFYERCCRCGEPSVQWHHVTLLGYQVDEKWAIVPACIRCHKLVDTDRSVKHFFETVAVCRMTPEDREKHPKLDYEAYLHRSYTVKKELKDHGLSRSKTTPPRF